MNVKATAVQRAIALLNSAGAAYRIEFEDQIHDTLPKAKGKSYKKTGINYRAVYDPILQRLETEDCLTFDAPEGMPASALRAALISKVSDIYGQGNFISSVKGNSIEILVIREPK